MALETHHKIIIGSFGTLAIIFMIISSTFIYLVYEKESVNYDSLNKKISSLQNETNSKISDLTSSVSQTSIGLNQTNSLLNTQVGSLNKQISSLKASVGEDFSGVIDALIKSVVTIKTDSAQGTGFIISSDGYVVTNAHVLADSNGMLATGIQAITSDQIVRNAQFVGYDGNLDIAVLKIPGSYKPVSFGNSDNVKVGQKVAAIGNPYGLQFSATTGIVSAINRRGSNGLNVYIQTDAPINPGNSGGPLIDTNGNVIGINNFKISSAEGLGFALESNYIVQAINSISGQKLNQTLIQ